MRLMEAMRLRVKDVELTRKEIIVRDGIALLRIDRHAADKVTVFGEPGADDADVLLK